MNVKLVGASRNQEALKFKQIDINCFSNGKFYLLTYLLTYFLIPCSRVLEKLTGSQLVKKFLAFFVNRRLIAAFTSARHLSLS